jgi:NAD(P)-dependent dehydrogenase (short-subunit alcohol dehydrogenase family)
VVLLDRAPSPPRELSDRASERFVLIGGTDLTDADSARRAISEAAGSDGKIHVLVNVAGGFAWQRLEEGSTDVWQKMFAINLATAVTATHAALPYLLAAGGARVINIGAGAAARAAAGMGAYTASKAGVERFTESLADELKDRGITVNAILPGTIDTPANRADMPDADHSRWVAPADIASVIVFLASSAAQAVNGAAIRVAGRG